MERCLAIMGEAAKRVPGDFRQRHADVPWREIAGLRDVLVHDYFGVDLDVLDEVVTTDVLRLKPQLERVMASEGWKNLG